MRWIWVALSGLAGVVGCSSAGDSGSRDDSEPDNAEVTGAAGQPHDDATGEVAWTTGDKRIALIAIHDAWQLVAALDARDGDAVAENLLRLAYRGGDISFGPPAESVGGSQSALSAPSTPPPDPGTVNCDASGCSFESFRFQLGFDFQHLQGTLRLEPHPAGRLLSIDLIDDDLSAAFAGPAHLSGALLIGDTTLDGGLSEVTPFDEGAETQAVGFSELTFEPGAFLPEATPLSGKVLGIWHSSQYPEQLALISFP